MTPRRIVVLSGLVVILFAFILFFERKMPTTTEAAQKKDYVWELPEDKIETIRLEQAGSVVELKKAGTGWRLTRPDGYPADAGAAGDLASQLAKLRRTGGDSAEARAEDYGLATPSVKATIGWKDASGTAKPQSRTVEFGVDIPGTEATAARVAGTTRIFFVPSTVATAVRKGPEDFRSKDVFGASDVSRVDIERGRGRVSFARKNGIWWLSQPVVDLADSDFSQRFIDQLTGMKALEFLSAGDRQNLAALGLSPALYRVTLSDGKSSPSVEFGATRSDGNSVYARREGQVFTVPSAIVEDLSKEAVAFREPRLVRFDRAVVSGIAGTFGTEQFTFERKDPGWSSNGARIPAASADDLMTAVLDLKSRSFIDDASAEALKSRTPAATVTIRLLPSETWTVQVFPVRGETDALVSGRPGAFQLPADAGDRVAAAFRKAAAAPPAKK